MSLFDFLGLGKSLEAPIKALGTLYTTDKERLLAETDFEQIAQKPQLAQLENNKLLILTNRIFNSGWQPLIGWTAGACVFLYWVPQLLIATYIWSDQCFKVGTVVPYPILPEDIYNIVWLLFGFGGYSLIKKKMQL